MIITACGTKGGVGKTTVLTCLAAEWMERGRRVQIIDADPQGAAHRWVEAARSHGQPAPSLVRYDHRAHRGTDLAGLCVNHDVTLIDCPPGNPEIQRRVLMTADVALMPCAPTVVDIWGLAETIDMVNRARLVRAALMPFVLVNRRQPRTTLGEQAREMISSFGQEVLTTMLGNRVDYQRCPAVGLGISTYAPMTQGADEVRALADEIGERRRAQRVTPVIPMPLHNSYKAWQEHERLTVYEPNFSYG